MAQKCSKVSEPVCKDTQQKALLQGFTKGVVLGLRFSSSPRNAISEADAARKCGVFAWKGVSESKLSSIPFHAKAEALQASPAPADCSRTPREVRRRPAPEQISSLLRHSFYLNARPHPTPLLGAIKAQIRLQPHEKPRIRAINNVCRNADYSDFTSSWRNCSLSFRARLSRRYSSRALRLSF